MVSSQCEKINQNNNLTVIFYPRWSKTLTTSSNLVDPLVYTVKVAVTLFVKEKFGTHILISNILHFDNQVQVVGLSSYL